MPQYEKTRYMKYPPQFSPDAVTKLKAYGIKFINWNSFSMAAGPGLTTEWFDNITNRLRKRQSVILAITGPPGEGKTWFGLRLAQILDKRFDVRKQVCFTRDTLAKIIGGVIKIRAGQVILLDEAHISAGARHWTEELQRELVDQLAAIRSRGFIVMIVVLHISMIDKILREFVITYQLHMEERGVATVYERYMPRFQPKVYHPRWGTIMLSVPYVEDCPSPTCLWCKHKATCGSMRAIYEREKRKFLNLTSASTIKKVRRYSALDMTTEGKIELIYKHRDMLHLNTKGDIHPASIQAIFEEFANPIGMVQAGMLAKRAQWKYPELVGG